MLSCVPDESDAACANCGKQGSDIVKLKNCTACRLVKYCGVDCQKAHRKQHKKACKQRAAELKGEGSDRVSTGKKQDSAMMMICGACERTLPEDSFSGEQRGLGQSSRRCEECVATGNQLVLMRKGRTRSEEDECPICNLLLPLEVKQSVFRPCCMKEVCVGCAAAAWKRGMRGCPFCRTPDPEESSQTLAMIKKRADAGDPKALYVLGDKYRVGLNGLEKDVARAVELYKRAAELDSKDAHFRLGLLYYQGTNVEKDTVKAMRHYEAAAMRGHVKARFNLGIEEGNAGNYGLALQHFLIAANLGHEISLINVKGMFKHGLATKADYAEALREHQRAVQEMTSPNREEEAKALGLQERTQ